jgi:hypothetical protein
VAEFSVNALTQSSIQYLYTIRDSIWLDPPYQRMSDIWTKDKQQLLIDSILNEFDIPKLYFHELIPPKKKAGKFLKHAIIDGKQRLDAIWGFIEGSFALADDFEYLHDSTVNAKGMTYAELSHKYPLIRSRFDGTTLSVVNVRTDDIDLIEEMFSRLNEAVPLNAPEKRNAFGGPLPPQIRQLAEHEFFASKLPFADKRYKHRDLATKFLYSEFKDGIVDTKKVYLDHFVREWADSKSDNEAKQLRNEVEDVLAKMVSVFEDQDKLLQSLGMVILIYHLFRFYRSESPKQPILRQQFELFEVARQMNRLKAKESIASANYDLLEFDKFVQTPNDAYANKIRFKILAKFFVDNGASWLKKISSYAKDD